MLRLGWHFDFHSHREVHIGRHPDPQGVAAALAEAGVEEMITFAKGHGGYTYYPTQVPTCYQHPKMVGDPFGDIVHAVKARGIRVVAYVSFGIDGEGARHHPAWRQVGPQGPTESEDWFIPVCPFTSYTDECVLPQIEEILNRYPVDGLFFDTMGALGICYCPCCRCDFKEKHDLDIPSHEVSSSFDLTSDPSSCEAWSLYGRFRHDRGLKLLARISAFIQQRRPGATVGFNQVGSAPYPEEMPAGCTRLTLDFATFGRQSRQASLCAAYGSSTPVEADVMPTIFNGGWGDWTAAPQQRLEQTTVCIWARRCGAYMGDRLHPDNRLAASSIDSLKHLRDLRSRLAVHWPPEEAKLAPDMAILHSHCSQYGDDYRHFAIDAKPRLQTVYGAADLLLDSGQNYTLTGEYCMSDLLANVKLVVLPEPECISSQADDLLQQFARRGGQVLIVGRLPRVERSVLSWAGVSQEPTPWQDHVYLPAFDTTNTPHPVLVRGNAFAATSTEAEVIQPIIAPLDMRHGVRFGWGTAPPSEKPSQHAAVTRRPMGDHGGAVWFLAAPIFSSYAEMGNWQQVRYLTDLVARILPRPLAHLHSPYGQVELVTYQYSTAIWAVLINHGGEVLHGDQKWSCVWGPVPPYHVDLRVRGVPDKAPVAVNANGQTVDFNWSHHEGTVSVPITMDRFWCIVRLQWL